MGKRQYRFGALLLLMVCIGIGLVGCGGGKSGTNPGGNDPSAPANGVGYIITVSSGAPSTQPDQAIEFKNFYGICWDHGTATENLRYAKNMGFKYITYWTQMEESPNLDNMNFYVETPHYQGYFSVFNDFAVRLKHHYSDAEKNNMERYFAWKSRDAFPNNIATGWFYNDTDFTPQPDFQQQAVINYFINYIVEFIKSVERPARGFRFAGITVDVPMVSGDFYSGPPSKGGTPTTLAFWTGSDSALLHEGISHEYPTYSLGLVAYYKQLLQRLRQEFPGRPIRFIIEPYDPYNDLIKAMNAAPDYGEIMPDLILQEGRDLAFVEDQRLFETGLITHDRMGCTTPDEHSERGNRLIAAKAAINGSWFTWFGRFGGTGDMIDYNTIADVPHHLQLLRVVANWDNLAGIPLAQRAWDGTVYKSPNSYMDGHVVATRNPYTGKIYIVFLDRQGKFTLQPGETVQSIRRVDNYFGEAGDGSGDIQVNGEEIRLK